MFGGSAFPIKRIKSLGWKLDRCFFSILLSRNSPSSYVGRNGFFFFEPGMNLLYHRGSMIISDTVELRGLTPTGRMVTIKHLEYGPSRFEVFLRNTNHNWLPMLMVEEELGIHVYRKKSGSQEGRPAEAVLRAIWRHFVSRVNDNDSTVARLRL